MGTHLTPVNARVLAKSLPNPRSRPECCIFQSLTLSTFDTTALLLSRQFALRDLPGRKIGNVSHMFVYELVRPLPFSKLWDDVQSERPGCRTAGDSELHSPRRARPVSLGESPVADPTACPHSGGVTANVERAGERFDRGKHQSIAAARAFDVTRHDLRRSANYSLTSANLLARSQSSLYC
jgi:hypothetical protein